MLMSQLGSWEELAAVCGVAVTKVANTDCPHILKF